MCWDRLVFGIRSLGRASQRHLQVVPKDLRERHSRQEWQVLEPLDLDGSESLCTRNSRAASASEAQTGWKLGVVSNEIRGI